MAKTISTPCHLHSFIYGGAQRAWRFRKKAEHYGLWGYVCAEKHHEHGPESPHDNAEVALHLKQVAQRAFEEKYGRELWEQEFGKNYLDMEVDDAE